MVVFLDALDLLDQEVKVELQEMLEFPEVRESLVHPEETLMVCLELRVLLEEMECPEPRVMVVFPDVPEPPEIVDLPELTESTERKEMLDSLELLDVPGSREMLEDLSLEETEALETWEKMELTECQE